jgi:hypothetical protein
MKNFSVFALLFAGVVFAGLMGCDYMDDDTYGNDAGPSDVDLKINEIMSNGDVDDWFEIYNPGDALVDLSGFGTWDPGMAGDPYMLPSGTSIAAHGYLVIVCNDIATGLETNFKLSSGGESVSLSDATGALIDAVEFPALEANTAWARVPDGSASFQVLQATTPGSANDGTVQNQPPVIADVARSPLSPTPMEDVVISAGVTDDGSVALVVLMVAIDGGDATEFPMVAAGDLYSAQIPAQAEGISVSYSIIAEDDEGLTASNPAEGSFYTYISTAENYVVELVVNEFLASNDACCPDEFGDFDDWIEIYNAGDTPVDLGGMYITDDLMDYSVWQIPGDNPDSTTLAPGGFLLFWADKEPDQGVLHLDLKLSGGGEQVGLFASDAFNNIPIDTLTYSEQNADISLARIPDGGATWELATTPTPGTSNGE